MYCNKQRISLRIEARKLRFSTRKVSNILRICLLKKAFKAKIRLRLTECQRRNRVAASQALLEQNDVLQHTWFTDESWFFSDGIAQKRDQYFWALSKDAVEPIESQLALIKVMVWGAVSVNGLIGPYFFIKIVLIYPLTRKLIRIASLGLLSNSNPVENCPGRTLRRIVLPHTLH